MKEVMIEEEENKNEETEEFSIDLKFFDTKIEIKINSDFVSFISNICKIIKISEEDINSVIMFYLDADKDKINLSNKGDYEIFYAQVKDNTVKGIELEIRENSNLNPDECLANFFNYIEQNEKQQNKNNNKKNDYKNDDNNINNIINEERINKIYLDDEKNENKIIQINEDNENNNNEIKFIDNYFNNNEIFEICCSSCDDFPILNVLYFCYECDIYLCSKCHKNTYNHPHIIYTINSKEELINIINDYNGNDNEELNMENNNNKKTKKKSKQFDCLPKFIKNRTKGKISSINKKEKEIKKK